jgi:4-hydroxy-tetrahydrodipicolinate synthase
MDNRKHLQGVFPILATTFHDDGSLDLASQENLVHERITLLKLVRNAAEVPLIVSTGHSGTDLAAELSRKAEDLGADALMVLPPSFMKTDADGLMFYYEAVSKAVRIPIMVQDAPLMTQVAMPASLLAKMGRQIENVKYAKVEAPPTAPKIGALHDIIAFGGLNGNFFIEEYNRGARGIMPGSDMIDSFACIWNFLEAGDQVSAWRIFTRILPLIRFELQPGLGVSAMKHNLKSAGVIASSHVRHPCGSVDKAGLAELDFLRDYCR